MLCTGGGFTLGGLLAVLNVSVFVRVEIGRCIVTGTVTGTQIVMLVLQVFLIAIV